MDRLISCRPDVRLLRDDADKLLRYSDGRLLRELKCIGTINAVVSGITGHVACQAFNGAYVLPQSTYIPSGESEAVTYCLWQSQNPGGSAPAGASMHIGFLNNRHIWDMEILTIFSNWRNQDSDCEPSHWPPASCGMGVWRLQGTLGVCVCSGGVYADVTTEWAT